MGVSRGGVSLGRELVVESVGMSLQISATGTYIIIADGMKKLLKAGVREFFILTVFEE